MTLSNGRLLDRSDEATEHTLKIPEDGAPYPGGHGEADDEQDEPADDVDGAQVPSQEGCRLGGPPESPRDQQKRYAQPRR